MKKVFVLLFLSVLGLGLVAQTKITKSTFVYATPSKAGKRVGRVNDGQEVRYVEKNGEFAKIRFQNNEGFIPLVFINIDYEKMTTIYDKLFWK